MCVSIFDAEPRERTFPTVRGPHHTSIEDAKAAAQQGCYLCSELLLDYDFEAVEAEKTGFHSSRSALSFELKIHVVSSPNGRLAVLTFECADGLLASGGYEIVHNEQLSKPQAYDVYLQDTRTDLLKEPWRVREDGFPASTMTIPGSTGDVKVLEIAAGWLNSCLERHPKCNKSVDPLWTPKRLLDLSSVDKQRIMVTREERPEGRYATLSHCWGKDPICCLTADNIEGWKRDLPTDVLTRTFRDAIAATRMLNIRYLWIDSLCIMQAGTGSKEDWQEHAVSMRLVYSHSLLNIAAARAENGADGAFASRTETFLRPCHVRWTWPSSHFKQLQGFFWTIRKAERHQSFGIRTLPLYTRGWVVQERFLAPRVLHFGKDRIFWECVESGVVEESFPAGFQESCPEYDTALEWPFDLSYTQQRLVATGGVQRSETTGIHAAWLEMINEYTRCDLSFPEKDILVALAGIAEKFGQYFDHRYVAGFFLQHLPFDLLWQNKGELSDDYRAPSWSWASIDGQVQFTVLKDCPYCDACCNRLADVKDVEIELVNNNIVYGPIRKAKLVLNAYLWPCRIEPVAQSGTGLRQRMDIHWRASRNDVPPVGSISNQDPIYWNVPGKKFPGWSASLRDRGIVWGEAEIDDEDDSIAGSFQSDQFTAFALPIMELKDSRTNAYHRHWGLLLKRTRTNQYSRLGTYRVRDGIMDRILEENRFFKEDICLV
jgi:hypothetical protein